MSRMVMSTFSNNLTPVETLSQMYFVRPMAMGSTPSSIQKQKTRSSKTKDSSTDSEKSQKKTLIMVLWVSVVFSSSRFVFAIANLLLLFMENSVYNWWGSGFNYFFSACTYSSYILVYIKTNKIFRKKFYQIFLRKTVN
jgi:hypothetical protein